MFVATLYKTKTPKASVWDAEYYTLSLGQKNGKGFVLTEKHGWWDDALERPVNNFATLSTDEG